MNPRFEQYEALLRTRDYESLTPQEKALVGEFADAAEYAASRAVLLQASALFAASQPMPGHGVLKAVHVATGRRSGYGVWLWPVVALVMLLGGLWAGYQWASSQAAAPKPQAVVPGVVHDTIYIDRPVEKIIYKDRIILKPASMRKDTTTVFASYPQGPASRPLKDDQDLLRFVNRLGI